MRDCTFEDNTIAKDWLNLPSTRVVNLYIRGQAEKIEEGAFDSCVFNQTQSINFDNLLISRLTSGVFKGLSSIKTLQIGNSTKLKEIANYTFSRLTQLKSLNLANSNIQKIDTGAFTGANNLVEINLSGNKLTTLSSGVVTAIAKRSKAVIDLTRNPWQCDCSLLELQSLLTNKNLRGSFTNRKNIRCAIQWKPYRVYGASVMWARLCKWK